MLRNLASKALVIHVRHSSSVSSSPGKWTLVSSVCVQRKPIVTKDMSELETRVQKLLFEMEKESSWKSDWELQIETDLKTLQEIKGGDSTKVGGKLCRDWEDEWKAELANFKMESRLTEFDKKKDQKSWHQSLDNTLILLVQQKDSGDRWILPHGQHTQGETMRQAAERVFKERCGGDLGVQFYGNAPCGFFKLKYSKSLREKTGLLGEKIFFYKAFLSGGKLKSSPLIKDFKWVALDELKSTLPRDYCKSVEMFLFDENY